MKQFKSIGLRFETKIPKYQMAFKKTSSKDLLKHFYKENEQTNDYNYCKVCSGIITESSIFCSKECARTQALIEAISNIKR